MESILPWAYPDVVQASVWVMALTGSLPLTFEPSLVPNSETNSTSTSTKVIFFGKHKVEMQRKWDHCHQENFGRVQYPSCTTLLTPPSAIMGISWETQQVKLGAFRQVLLEGKFRDTQEPKTQGHTAPQTQCMNWVQHKSFTEI